MADTVIITSTLVAFFVCAASVRVDGQSPWEVDVDGASFQRWNRSLSASLDVDGPVIQNVCGRTQNPSVAGRAVAVRREFPWLAALLVYRPDRIDADFCAATLINNRYVLTSARCTQEAVRFEVLLGAYNLLAGGENGRIAVAAATFYAHPDWNGGGDDLNGGLSLVRLDYSVDFTDFVKPMCLPGGSAPAAAAGEAAVIAGWDVDGSSVKKVATTIEPAARCSSQYVAPDVLCTSDAEPLTCYIDDGVALAVVRDGRWTLAGVQLVAPPTACGATRVFTDVANYVDWIKRTSSESSGSSSTTPSTLAYATAPLTILMLYVLSAAGRR